MQRPLCWLSLICASCYAEIGGVVPDAELPRRTYFETCDGSGGVALDADRFLVLADDEPVARIYARGGERPLAQHASALGVEDAARVGDRVYTIGGDLTAIAIDTFAYASSLTLRADLADATMWTTPNDAVIARATEVRFEGLAHAPTIEQPSRLWLGMQSPLVDDYAVAISLPDPAAAITSRARFGEAALLDLGGAGIRGMAWSDALAAVLIVAGPVSIDRYRLFRWSGNAADAPSALVDITAPAGAIAEAIVVYPSELQIVFDMSDAMIASAPCRQLAAAERSFQDVIVRVD